MNVKEVRMIVLSTQNVMSAKSWHLDFYILFPSIAIFFPLHAFPDSFLVVKPYCW